MFTRRKFVSGVVAAVAFGVVGAGCETAGLDSLPSTGIASAIVGKPAPEPDLQERPKLVMPPSNAPLPVPGEKQQAAGDIQTSAYSNAKNQKNGG